MGMYNVLSGRLSNSNNFTYGISAALAKVCALLSVILVVDVSACYNECHIVYLYVARDRYEFILLTGLRFNFQNIDSETAIALREQFAGKQTAFCLLKTHSSCSTFTHLSDDVIVVE